jgi:hypothetical protein
MRESGLWNTIRDLLPVCACLRPSLLSERLNGLRRGGDKSLAFPIAYFTICGTTKRIFMDGLKKLEQRSHKCVELKGEYVE